MTDHVHKLYRFYDRDGQLLYIGVTVNPGKRMERHRATKPWWSDVARIDMQEYATRPELLAAEKAAIRAEQPLHNIRLRGSSVIASAATVYRDPPERCEEWFGASRAERWGGTSSDGSCLGVATYRVWPLGREHFPGAVAYTCGRCVEFYTDSEPI